MISLGIDTSSEWLTVALGEKDRLLAGESLYAPRRHIAILHQQIDKVLKQAGRKIDEVELFIAVKGPGSFTGIRIAVTVVKCFSYLLEKKCISLISLDLLAQNAIEQAEDFILPLLDARRGQVYTSLYRKESSRIKRVSDYQLLKVEDILERVEGSLLLLGDGVRIYREAITKYAEKKKITVLNEDFWRIRPQNIIKLAYQAYQERGSENIFDLNPFYIYPKECTVTVKK